MNDTTIVFYLLLHKILIMIAPKKINKAWYIGILSKKWNIYEGIVDSEASYGTVYFIVIENGTMINIKYVQTIEIIN